MISEVGSALEIVGGILDQFYYQCQLGWNYYFDDWNNVVKINDYNEGK